MTRGSVLATVAISVLVVAASPADQPTVVSLASATLGSLPDGFASELTGRGVQGHWEVVEEPSASGGRVLAQTSADRTDYRFPLAVYQNLVATNVEATVRFKAVNGRGDRAGGKSEDDPAGICPAWCRCKPRGSGYQRLPRTPEWAVAIVTLLRGDDFTQVTEKLD
jgi:hypothetical protein